MPHRPAGRVSRPLAPAERPADQISPLPELLLRPGGCRLLIRRIDRGLVWLNILFLLPLCLLPFGAGMLGRYEQEPVALRIDALVLVAIAVMRLVIWLYATNRPHLLWLRLDDRQRRAGLALAACSVLVYLVAILVAEVAPGGVRAGGREDAGRGLAGHRRRSAAGRDRRLFLTLQRDHRGRQAGRLGGWAGARARRWAGLCPATPWAASL